MPPLLPDLMIRSLIEGLLYVITPLEALSGTPSEPPASHANRMVQRVCRGPPPYRRKGLRDGSNG